MNQISHIATFVFDLLFPIKCIGCGCEFENEEPKKRWICKGCLEKVELRKEQVCPVCEKLSDGGKTHYHCAEKTSLDGLWVATWYDLKIISDAIHKLKFGFIRDMSFPLSEVMERSILEAEEFSDFHDILMSKLSKESFEESVYIEKEKNRISETIVVPVPLHRKRYNWRGFNQSFLLADGIVSKFGLEVSDGLLIRKKNTKPQTKIKSQEERKENIKGAFCCPDGSLANGRNIIIVDDVCTTLATLNECAMELKKAGAKNVWGLVVARR